MLTKTTTQITTAENHLIEINCDHCAKTNEMNFIAGLKAWRHSVCALNWVCCRKGIMVTPPYCKFALITLFEFTATFISLSPNLSLFFGQILNYSTKRYNITSRRVNHTKKFIDQGFSSIHFIPKKGKKCTTLVTYIGNKSWIKSSTWQIKVDSVILWKTKLQKVETCCVHLNVWYKVIKENGAWWKILEFYLTLKSNFELANSYEFKFV